MCVGNGGGCRSHPDVVSFLEAKRKNGAQWKEWHPEIATGKQSRNTEGG